jgi:hypothetical protein
MKYLRNQIQHNGLLVTNFSFDGKKISDNSEKKLYDLRLIKIQLKQEVLKLMNLQILMRK